MDHMLFVFQFVNMVYHIDWFAHTKESLHPWDKSHLIIVYDLFNVLLEFVCYYFVQDFISTFISDIGLYDFLFCDIPVWFWYQGDSDLIEWVWNCSSICNFLEEFEKDRC